MGMLLLLFCIRSSGKAGSHVPAVWPRSRKELGQDNGRVSAEIILAILKAVLEDSSYSTRCKDHEALGFEASQLPQCKMIPLFTVIRVVVKIGAP